MQACRDVLRRAADTQIFEFMMTDNLSFTFIDMNLVNKITFPKIKRNKVEKNTICVKYLTFTSSACHAPFQTNPFFLTPVPLY